MTDPSSFSASSATVRESSPAVEGPGDEGSVEYYGIVSEETGPQRRDDENGVRGVSKAPLDAEVASKSNETVPSKCRYSHEPQRPAADSEERVGSENQGISTISPVTKPTPSVNPNPIIGLQTAQNSSQEGTQTWKIRSSETLPASSPPTSFYSLRNRGPRQNKLVYDLKYHPMDDSIRPSQAAKHRSAHGEQLPSSDDSSECFSVCTDADTQPLSDDNIQEESARQKMAHKHIKNGMKRLRERSRSSPQPTQRSSRRVSDEKKSYDMSVHPQDKALELLSSDDEEVSTAFPKRRKTKLKKDVSEAGKATDSKMNSIRSKQTVISSDSESTVFDEDLTMGGDRYDAITQMSPKQIMLANDTCAKSTSPTPSISTPPLHGIRRKESLDVWKLFPGNRYFRHDLESWPFTPGQPFDIWTEQAEDQVAEEALAALPLDFEHDDKENQLDNIDQQNSDPLEGLAVIPASHYRRSDEDVLEAQNTRLVTEALYNEEDFDFDTYGLDSTDGANDEGASCRQVHGANEDIIRLLASGAHLPRGTAAQKL